MAIVRAQKPVYTIFVKRRAVIGVVDVIDELLSDFLLPSAMAGKPMRLLKSKVVVLQSTELR